MDLPKARTLSSKIGYFATGLAVAVTMGGCPVGAELENPERFDTGVVGTGGAGPTGGTGGSAGTTGGASGSGAAGTAGAAAGSAGTGGATFSCDVTEALTKSCGRTGCHSAAVHYADLTLIDPATVAEQMVGKMGTHGDIDCAPAGEPFRECMPNELPSDCATAGPLIDPANVDNSWVLKKLDPAYALNCGAKMPAPPGDSASNGWSEARRQCLIDFFRSLATAQ
jgi:hypothetical protein